MMKGKGSSSSPAEWSQCDLERNESVKFCRQYVVFHDDKSVVYSGPSGNCTEIKGEYVCFVTFLLFIIGDGDRDASIYEDPVPHVEMKTSKIKKEQTYQCCYRDKRVL